MRLSTSLSVAAVWVELAVAQLKPMAFNPLPLGAVMPSGWLNNQVQLQANGLAGHEMEFYNYIAQSTWLGGTAAYSNLEEAGSYWFNGLVGTGVLSASTKVMNQTRTFINYVIAHQGSDGWLGPEDGSSAHPKFLWGRYPLFLGIMQMIDSDPSLTSTLLPPILKFISLSNSMLQSNQGLEEWGQARWFEYAIFLQWLSDHPSLINNNTTTQALLLDTMQRLRNTGTNWVGVFNPQFFPKIPAEQAGTPPFGDITWHGVNVGEGLKAGAVAWRFTGNQTDLDASVNGWDILFQYHGRPSGIFGADEYLAGLEAFRGTELCTVVETMFSGSYLYQVTGLAKFADRTERMAYNALPATITGDMWAHQYLQQNNQIASINMDPNPFPRDGSYSNVFGLEPNYPCCTVNHPQGWPKFISNAFLTTPDGKSLVHLYLGPFSTTATLNNGANKVTALVDTQYPFSDTLTTTITSAQAFTYYVRIPSWVSGGTISINSAAKVSVSPDAKSGLFAVNVGAGKTTLVLNLPAPITLESRPHGAVAVQRGPLHYAFEIPRTTTVLATNSQQPSAKDYQFTPAASWNYAIDTSSLAFVQNSSTSLSSPIFESNAPPVSITATACLVLWPSSGSLTATYPPTNPSCIGAKKTIVLTPYGSTRLRIGEFPTIAV